MERLPERMDSKFRFVLVASNRAEQLMRGARPKLEMAGKKKTIIAMDEAFQEKIDWDYGPAPEPELPEALAPADPEPVEDDEIH